MDDGSEQNSSSHEQTNHVDPPMPLEQGEDDQDLAQPVNVDGPPPSIQEEEADGKESVDGTDTQGQDPLDALPEDADPETVLKMLTAGAMDQEDLERTIGQQADQMLRERDEVRDKKALDRTETAKARLVGQLRRLEQRHAETRSTPSKIKLQADINDLKGKISTLDTDIAQINQRMRDRQTQQDAGEVEEDGGGRRPGESRRDFLLRTGKITPFSKIGLASMKRAPSNLAEALMDAEMEEEDEQDEEELEQETAAARAPMSHQNLRRPGFADFDTESEKHSLEDTESDRPAKKRKLKSAQALRTSATPDTTTAAEDTDTYKPDLDAEVGESEDTDVVAEDADGDFIMDTAPARKKARPTKKRKAVEGADEPEEEDFAGVDDGNEKVYQERIRRWAERRSAARRKVRRRRQEQAFNGDHPDGLDPEEEDDQDEEWHRPHPTIPDTEFDGGYKVPGDIYPSLFDYQKTAIEWLWELYRQQVGGIIGDEMGLGKTVQIISFLAGLHYSKKLTKPIIVVCPATVMKQWVNEFHTWWPPLRVSILHTSGSGMIDIGRESRMEDMLETRTYNGEKPTKASKAAKRIVNKVVKDGHVLVTTYSGLQTYADQLIPVEWDYAVLDEGHKIRNPNTSITIYCKELRTPNRVILSGTPMQNNLTELWSLFDFIFPMRLGTLVNFRSQFEIPIKQGGYANASNLQIETAMKCAETLKDAISPYLLQRFKVDVAADLPKKTERVLFCLLTRQQREAYESFLNSEEMKSILNGKRQALFGIDILRKICNHPDLVEHKTLSIKPSYDYGNGVKSGKMQVMKSLIELWKKQGHKTLLFAQHRIMLDILERFMRKLDGFNYRRMDGNTPIKERQDLVDEFNRDPNIHVFLLTTKVGGLGVNLTGADRVIIFDPDWNPSTDVQARERAWRLGQKKEVEVYRLMTAGTIEEKIYHRQIFKQFLTNKILRDPKQRQTFQLQDLHDLFSLGNASSGSQTETASIFKGTEMPLSNTSDKSKEAEAPRLPSIIGISHAEDFNEGDRDISTSTTTAATNGTAAETAVPATDQSAGSNDDRILTGIFSRAGVHSAIEHDAIISGNSRRVTADPELITREAKRVAAQAAKELQRSVELARHVPVGTPTWTGQVGVAGRPEERRFANGAMRARGGFGGRGGRGGMGSGRGGGPSSSAILSNLQSRQMTNVNSLRPASPATTTSRSRSSTPNPPSRGGAASRTPGGRPQQPPLHSGPSGKELMLLIRDYILAQGGSTYTQMLTDHFAHLVKGGSQQMVEFKEMLKTIAVLENRGGAGRARGRWVLKEEFRPKGGEGGLGGGSSE